MSLYKQMSLEERENLYMLLQKGTRIIEIAKTLNRHKSTIYNEIKRNTIDKKLGYLPDSANNLAMKRKAARTTKIQRLDGLKKKIIRELKQKWSPEIIANRMRLKASRYCVSTETIYQFIYSDAGNKLRLYKYLCKARPRRSSVRGRTPQKGKIPDRVSIHDRPAEIQTRAQLGHFEGDLTFFAQSQSINIAVMVERKSRFVQLTLNSSKKTTVVMQNMFNKLALLPACARKSITFDNGLEFTRHSLLQFINMSTYFCDKHSPWQKGQVEQMNVMLHRYLPKNSDLKQITQEKLNLIQHYLNTRPRKCLGFRTPTEVFRKELYNAVALQT